jgi:hypothetical protein
VLTHKCRELIWARLLQEGKLGTRAGRLRGGAAARHGLPWLSGAARSVSVPKEARDRRSIFPGNPHPEHRRSLLDP